MKKIARKSIVSGILCLAATSPTGVWAFGCPPYNTGLQVGETTAMETALSQLWSTAMNTLKQAMLSFDRQELGAMKVLASQLATQAKAEIKAKQSVGEAKISSLAYLNSTQAQMEAYRKYSPQTGQGVDPCGQLKSQTIVQLSQKLADELSRDWIRMTSASPGRYGDPAAFFRKQNIVRAQFATADDEKLGLGKANKSVVTLNDGTPFPLAGADTNGSVLFADTADARITTAKLAFLENLAGAPDPAVPKGIVDTPATREYTMAKSRKDALMSASLYSLSTIAAEHTPHGKTVSKNQALRDVRDLYFGSKGLPRSAAWSNQDQRGLKIDKLKIDGAILAAKQEQYKSGQRMEMLLAALVTHHGAEQGAQLSAMAAELTDVRSTSPVN